MSEFGLIELFRPRPGWFRLSAAAKKTFLEKVTASIGRGEAQGGRLFGPYWCRWSSEWQMFAFWEVKNLEAAQALAREAEELGWFEYFEQTNIIGAKTTPEDYAAEAAMA